ncbi:rod binding protein [Roseibium hamelinense]|uniref:Rod binding protein n=1 Tax=Roseibium hamelinense TaxID=150831 RepID=A0A562TH64_9HYPH|nr:rod-binding protein [Roseibium hamelinense]MTI45903.1 hypothetical protein [Roseibium hamelinense]TWI92912.1 rod binding protein [Roseibium hamelinense]
MAISPPSDLIMDVVKAAEPTAMKQAAQKLQKLAMAPEGASQVPFSDLLSGVRPGAAMDRAPMAQRVTQSESPAQKFEAVILHQFVETMLPKNAEAVFGEGSTGEIWKSMMAEQVANQIAASGGVGIAGLLSDKLQMGAKV